MSKVYGLHFGLNEIGFIPPTTVGKLRHAENDALSYHKICQNLGWESNIFISKDATVNNFLESLRTLSESCMPNDLIVVSFSGHGTRVKDINFDEEDEYDEILVFYDKLLIDDSVKIQFSRFREGVNIFYITDCCHSGTITKLFDLDMLKDPEYFERGFDSEIAQKIFDSNSEYRIIKQKINEESVILRSSIIHYAACQDDETASDGSVIMKHGLLTHRLLKTWNDGLFNGNYRDFFDSIKNQMGGNQNPKLNFEGIINNRFILSRPFSSQ
tara:strand:+ start:7847 stop:8659 length:813 start_codon:yes stop_codon:yes gene_type:complete